MTRLGLAAFAVVLALIVAYEAGRADTAQLALDAYERETHYQALGLRLLDASTKAMSVVLTHDAYLHAEIRAVVPEWHETMMLGRAVMEP